MDKKYLEEKGLLKEAKRFNYIMEYISGNNNIEEADGNGDGLDDATGMADPMAAGGLAGDPGTGPAAGAMAGQDPMGGGAMAGQDPTAAAGAAPGADPAAGGEQGVPGFDPQPVGKDEDPNATAEESFDEATPDNQEGGEDEEVIDVDELVDGQKRNEEAIDKLTDKFEHFLEKFSEFQGELKSKKSSRCAHFNQNRSRKPRKNTWQTTLRKITVQKTTRTELESRDIRLQETTYAMLLITQASLKL